MPRYLLNISARGRQTQQHFNVSSLCSRKDIFYTILFSQLSSILILFTVVVQNRFWKPLLKAGSATHVLLGTLGNFQNCHFQEHMDSCFCFFLFVILRSYFGDHFKSKFSKSFLWNSLSCAVATLIVINT